MTVAAAFFVAAFMGRAYGQSLARVAMNSFPADTVHVEYSDIHALRALPDYSSLRSRFVGPRLNALESSLAQLGIQESQIDVLVIGWRPASGGMDLYGIASGQFNLADIKASARKREISPENIDGVPAYCVGAGLLTECALVFSPTQGAFGTLETLSELMDVRHSAKPSLESNSDFAALVAQAEQQDPIWGVAQGKGVTDWFKGWISNSGPVQLDWSKVFSNVKSLEYGIQAGDNVQLSLKLNCNSANAAGSLQQVLEGLKLAQQLAWQNQNPGQANPFAGTDIGLDGSRVSLKMAATYLQLGKIQTVGSTGK